MPVITRPAIACGEHEVGVDELVEHVQATYAEHADLGHMVRLIRACQVKTRRLTRPLGALDGVSLGERWRRHFDDVSELAEQAARQAMATASVTAESVTCLIVVSSTGYRMPGLDMTLLRRLGLDTTTRRVPIVGMGCGGAACALTLAVERLAYRPDDIVLVVCADALMPYLHPGDTNTDVMIFRGLFGEGAAACVVRGADAGPGPMITDTWSYTVPGTGDIVGWNLGDDGFHSHNSSRIVGAATAATVALVEWLAGAHEFVVTHPGSPRILDAMARGIGPGGAERLGSAWSSLRERGNMGAASVLDVLARTFDDPPRRGSEGVLVAPAPGVTMIACAATWR